MTYRGTIRNGVVVFRGKRRPRDGTPVEVRPLPKRTTAAGSPGSPGRRPVASRNGSRRGRARSLDDIAREQGVTRIVPFDELLGGWPEGEEQDGFERTVAQWRDEEPRREF